MEPGVRRGRPGDATPGAPTPHDSRTALGSPGGVFADVAEAILYRWAVERDVSTNAAEVDSVRAYLHTRGILTSVGPDGRFRVEDATARTLDAAHLVLLGLRHFVSVRIAHRLDRPPTRPGPPSLHARERLLDGGRDPERDATAQVTCVYEGPKAMTLAEYLKPSRHEAARWPGGEDDLTDVASAGTCWWRHGAATSTPKTGLSRSKSRGLRVRMRSARALTAARAASAS